MCQQWCKDNQLKIHPFKTEAILIRKSPFIGPLPPLYFGSGMIHVVESSTCLGLKLDCRHSWSEDISQERKSLVQKVKAMKGMKFLLKYTFYRADHYQVRSISYLGITVNNKSKWESCPPKCQRHLIRCTFPYWSTNWQHTVSPPTH